MPYELYTPTIPLLVAGLMETAVGFFLATRWRGRPAVLAVGLFFLILGQRALVNFVASQAGDVTTWWAWARVGLLTAFADGLFLLFLLATYPRPRAWQPPWTTRAWPYVAAATLLGAVAIAMPWSFIDLRPVLDCTQVQPLVCPPEVSAVEGPLMIVDGLTELGTALVPIALMRQALRREAPPEWRAMLLLAAALSLARLYVMAGNATTWLANGAPAPTSVYDAFSMYAPVDTLLFLLSAPLAVLLASPLEPERKRHALGYAGIVVGTIALSVVTSLTLQGPEWAPTRALFAGVFNVLVPLIVAYALLRHDLLGLDLRVRWTIRRGTVAAVFVAVFVIATQVAQNVFSTQYGMVWGGVVTGALLVGIAPLQRVAERIADAAAPGEDTLTRRPSSPSEKERAYRNALAIALRDRQMSREEEVHLAHLAEQLGIGAQRAVELRHEVEDKVGAA